MTQPTGASHFQTISPLTRQVANAIAACCAEQQVQPMALRWADLKRWMKQARDLDAAELREVEAHVQQVGGFNTLRNAFFASLPPTANAIERVEVRGLAKLQSASGAVLANDEVFLNRFREVMLEVNKKPIFKPFGFSLKPSRERVQRVVGTIWSDLHFGSKLDPREVGVKYDFQEESRRLASVVHRICEFKTVYRPETTLLIFLAGDLIRGDIHDPKAGREVAEQSGDAMWLLRQAIRICAGRFPRVIVHCTSGNHDRDPNRHPHGATDGKWDSRATTIYYGLKLSLMDLPNVEVHIPRSQYIEAEVFGHRIYCTHGDSNLNPGNPGKAISISSIDNQMTRINLGEVKAKREPFDLFVLGHVHQHCYVPLPAGDLITNGCLIPPDAFAKSKVYVSSRPGQAMWEMTPKHVVGHHWYLDVDQTVDADASLDRLITPFSDF